jgi:hypothetical protein
MIHFSSPQIPRLGLCDSTTARANSLGILDKLPFEILHQLVQLLDFYTLVTIRSVNFAARTAIDAFPAFKYMTQYAAGALRALSQTRLVKSFTVAHLFHVSRTDRCFGCHKFGAFLFLLNCSRCCFKCLETDVRLRAIDLRAAKNQLGLKPRDLRSLPTMLSLPGTYALRDRRTIKRRLRLVSAVEAYTLSQKIYGDDTATTLAFRSVQYAPIARIREQAWASMHKSFRDPYRGLASTHFPNLDIAAKLIQLGISCRGCQEACRGKSQVKRKGVPALEMTARRERVYSEAEFKQHMKECDGVKWLKALDRRGGEEAAVYWSTLHNFDTMGKPRVRGVVRICNS